MIITRYMFSSIHEEVPVTYPLAGLLWLCASAGEGLALWPQELEVEVKERSKSCWVWGWSRQPCSWGYGPVPRRQASSLRKIPAAAPWIETLCWWNLPESTLLMKLLARKCPRWFLWTWRGAEESALLQGPHTRNASFWAARLTKRWNLPYIHQCSSAKPSHGLTIQRKSLGAQTYFHRAGKRVKLDHIKQCPIIIIA